MTAVFHVTRHTVATCLSNELSVDDRAIERLLHHTPQDVTRQRYNRGWPGVLECQARTLREAGPPD
jgi:integrase